MRHLPLIVVVALVVVSALDARTIEKFAPRGGQFQVKFPGKPKESTTNASSKLGKLKVFTATYANSDGNVYLVSYTDFPDGTAKGENRDAILDGIRTGLKGKDRSVLSESEWKAPQDGLVGQELTLGSDSQRVRMRVVLRGDRVFQVGVIGTAEFAKSDEANTFLESFELTK